jgi:hypothetical protein
MSYVFEVTIVVVMYNEVTSEQKKREQYEEKNRQTSSALEFS